MPSLPTEIPDPGRTPTKAREGWELRARFCLATGQPAATFDAMTAGELAVWMDVLAQR